MLVEFPFFNQIIATMPRDKTPSSNVIAETAVFEIPEDDPSGYDVAAVRTMRDGNHDPFKVYWRDGAFWTYCKGGVIGLDSARAKLDKWELHDKHWFTTYLSPEQFLPTHQPTGSFVGDILWKERVDPRRIVENYREQIIRLVGTAYMYNLRIVDGSVLVKVREPVYGLSLYNKGTKRKPQVFAHFYQRGFQPALGTRHDLGHEFPAGDWDGLMQAGESFRELAPDASWSDWELQPFDIRMPEVFTADPIVPSIMAVASRARRGILNRRVPDANAKDVSSLYEMIEHRGGEVGIADEILTSSPP